MIDEQREERQKDQHPWGHFRGHERWRTKEKEKRLNRREMKRKASDGRYQKKRKRTRSANNLVQKKMLRPCLQQLENYRGGNIWWRTTAEGGPQEAASCSRAQSNIRKSLRSQTHKHMHSNQQAVGQAWSSSEQFHVFFCSFRILRRNREKVRN